MLPLVRRTAAALLYLRKSRLRPRTDKKNRRPGGRIGPRGWGND